MTKRMWRIIIGGVVFAAAMILQTKFEWLRLPLFAAGYIVAGGSVLLKAGRNMIRGRVFDENFLMSIASLGAFIIGEYPEGVAVMLFYQIGELFEGYAVDKARKSIAGLMDIRPDFANVKIGGELVVKDPEEVHIGDVIVVKAGERIPLDGKVLEGSSMLDTSALTGESRPREVRAGDELLSGCININGALTAEVVREYGESTVSRILDLVENASGRKSHSETFIAKFAGIYTPFVVIVAAFLAFVPPLVIRGADFGEWLSRSLVFLVVSCPCALVISIPLSFFGGIGGASRNAILVKGGNYLEALAKTEIVVFDKTGTLTKGVFNVREVRSELFSGESLLELAAYAESYSNHPISQSLKRAYGRDFDVSRIADAEEMPGYGVRAVVDGRSVLAGNARLMEKMGISCRKDARTGAVVHVAVDGVYAGTIVIADEVKPDSREAIRALHALGIEKTVMLTGDSRRIGEEVAAELGIGRVYAELLPTDKVERIEGLFSEKSTNGKLVFVGDGINDAPVLARADIGIAMGGLGSDAAIEAADIVIMTDEPSRIADAIKISRKTLGIARQNTVFALGVKAAVLVLGALGLATMWAAVFADVGVSVIAILNSFRALNVRFPRHEERV
jgi:Cd2+/Zn2+-exporting ATPase